MIDLMKRLSDLPKLISEDGQDYVQLSDVLETVKRYSMGEWIDVNDRLPEKDGKYLIIVELFGACIRLACYSHDLFKVDDYDFKKGDSGFFDYDSEFGYYKVDKVLAWMELPEIPEKYLRKK